MIIHWVLVYNFVNGYLDSFVEKYSGFMQIKIQKQYGVESDEWTAFERNLKIKKFFFVVFIVLAAWAYIMA